MIDTIVHLRSGAIGAGGMIEFEIGDAAGQRILIQGRLDRADREGFDPGTIDDLAEAMERIGALLRSEGIAESRTRPYPHWGTTVRQRLFAASRRKPDEARHHLSRKRRSYFRALAYWRHHRSPSPASE